MRRFLVLMLMSAAVAASFLAGCGGDGESPGGTEGGGGSGASSSSSSTTTTSEESACAGMLSTSDCATCVENQCCGEMTACLADATCLLCVTLGPSKLDCHQNAPFLALGVCAETTCPDNCGKTPCDVPAPSPSAGSCITLGGPVQCNPLTNEPCDSSQVCSFDGNGFICASAQGAEGICQECGGGVGCQAGAICVKPYMQPAICEQICCTDADCGSGRCFVGEFPQPELGRCMQKALDLRCNGVPDGTCDMATESCECADCASDPTCL